MFCFKMTLLWETKQNRTGVPVDIWPGQPSADGFGGSICGFFVFQIIRKCSF